MMPARNIKREIDNLRLREEKRSIREQPTESPKGIINLDLT